VKPSLRQSRFVVILICLLIIPFSLYSQWVQRGEKMSVSYDDVPGEGSSVAISADGTTAIFGGQSDNSYTGAAWVYVLSGGVWMQQSGKLVGSSIGPAWQGASVAISADGNTAIVGGQNDNTGAGAAWVFTRSGTSWYQQAKLVGTGAYAEAHQGISVSISADGNTVDDEAPVR